MKKVLIYTIFRNCEKTIDLYYSQVRNIVFSFPDIDFYFSAYENDSTDSTKQMLLSKDWSFFKDYSIVTEDINTEHFGSVISEQRVKNLAEARNKAILAKGLLDTVDHVMMIESDVKYGIDAVAKILNFGKTQEFDIVSGFTWHIEDGIFQLYDKWATRRTDAKTYNEKGSGKPFIDLVENWAETDYGRYYSTSNGICLYRAEPFKKGIRYGHISSTTGEPDCEMYVVCEGFAKNGYNKIFIIHNALIEHGDSFMANRQIPKTIWQTYKTDYNNLPKDAKNASQTWKKLNPDYEYKYMNDRDIYKFVKYNYGEEMLSLMNSMKVPVMKADLWRYLVIYKYGGIYCDIDTICNKPIDEWIPHDSKMVVAPENGLHYIQWTFASEPKSPIIKSIIDVVVERCQNVDYGRKHFVHYHTGPDAFTEGIRRYFGLPDISHDCEGMKQHFNCFCGTLQNEAKTYVGNKKITDAGFFCFSGKNWEMFREIAVKHLFGSEAWDSGDYEQWTQNTLAKESRLR
jgi:hypothetical protein